ncbi:MAG: hypothetical protein E6R02_07240 [Gammaproteobacteria bacterium]|nr:MAG: hypothetical protein E6R02_07240 [Gammaproteobacteria bacterium]
MAWFYAAEWPTFAPPLTAWTAERKLNFPSIEQFRNGCQFRHTKEWPCTLQIAGVDVASSRVTPNQTVSLRANNSGTLIVTPLTTASLRGSKSYDAPSIPAGQSITTTVTVNGAATTDWASASLSVSPQGMTVQANISANNLSLVSIFNGTAGAIDLATATLSSWAQR